MIFTNCLPWDCHLSLAIQLVLMWEKRNSQIDKVPGSAFYSDIAVEMELSMRVLTDSKNHVTPPGFVLQTLHHRSHASTRLLMMRKVYNSGILQ